MFSQTTDTLTIIELPVVEVSDTAITRTNHDPVIVTKIRYTAADYGVYNHPLQFIQGRLPALYISSLSGSAGTDYSISSMGFNSVFGNTNATILLNGLPIDSYLKFINYQDINTYSTHYTDLEYSRFSGYNANGLLTIKTKEPDDEFHLFCSFKSALSWLPHEADVLTGDEFRTLLYQQYSTQPEYLALAGNSSTNWQKEITRKGFTHDAYFAADFKKGKFPMRFSYGNSKTEGIIRNSDLTKNTLSFVTNPTFLKDNLITALNLFYTDYNENKVDDNSFASAIFFAPTSPVYEDNSYGNYFAWNKDNGTTEPVPRNPVALINQQLTNERTSYVNASLKLKYGFKKIDGLSMGINAATIFSTQLVTKKLDTVAAWFSSLWQDKKMQFTHYKSFINPYISYDKSLSNNKYHLFFETGYINNYNQYRAIDRLSNQSVRYLSYNEMAAYASVMIRYSGLYSLSSGLTLDYNPWFSTTTHLYPAISGRWNIGNEKFMQRFKFLSQLHLTSSYSVSSHSPLPHYGIDLNENLKPSQTKKFNAGLYANLKSERFGFSLNYYFHSNKDVYFEHSNFLQTGMEIINSFSMRNSGLILSLDLKNMFSRPIRYFLNLSVDYNRNRMTDFSDLQGINVLFDYDQFFTLPPKVYYSGIGIGSFCLQQQEYDEDGKPVEGSYKPDGVVIDGMQTGFRTDRSSYPSLIAGINGRVWYKGFEFQFSGRAFAGNYIYNRLNANSVYSVIVFPGLYLNNLTSDIHNTEFNNQQFYSDYYLENASFFKMDLIGLGYTFENIKNKGYNLKITSALQNAFTITKYSGLDPEVVGGIDKGQYPRARTFTVGVVFEY